MKFEKKNMFANLRKNREFEKIQDMEKSAISKSSQK